MKKLILNFSPTGMVPTKEQTPHVPITPEEIAEDVKACLPLGVSMIHLHARDENGVPTHKKEAFERIIYKIKEIDEEVIIVATTSGRMVKDFDKRSEVLDIKGDLKPDMASLTLGSMNFMKTASVNAPDMVRRLVAKMQDNDIKPELEVFDSGMLNYAHYLIKKGLVEPPYYFNVLLGNIASAQADPLSVGHIAAMLPQNSYYSLAGLGYTQLAMNAMGIIVADGVRVGLEDNIWFDHDRTKKATNYELLERVSKMADLMQRPIASIQEVRSMLEL